MTGAPFLIRKIANRIFSNVPSLFAYQTADSFSLNALSAMQVPAVQRCVTLLSNDVGRSPCVVQEWIDDSWVSAPNSEINVLLETGLNSYMTRHEFFALAVRDYLLHGNFVAFIDRTGPRIELLPIPYGSWSLNYKQRENQLTYTVHGQHDVQPSQVIHFRNDLSPMPFYGASVLENHKAVVEMMIAQTRAASRAFKQAMGKTILSAPEGVNLSPDAIEKIQEKFAKVHGTYDNWDKPVVTGDGLKANIFQAEPYGLNSAAWAQGTKEIARAFGVPLSMLFETDQAGMTSSGTAPREMFGYIESALKPLTNRLAEQLAFKLLPAGKRCRIVFDFRKLLLGDTPSAIAAIRQGIDASIISPAEGRQMLNMDPGPPMLQEFVISKNYEQQSDVDADDVAVDASQGTTYEN